MVSYREIRADFDRESLVVYQAYRKEIAEPAIESGRFVEPFSWGRMTWIKPSFLWLMSRSNWGQKSGQEHILAVRIKRTGWDPDRLGFRFRLLHLLLQVGESRGRSARCIVLIIGHGFGPLFIRFYRPRNDPERMVQ